MSKVDPINQELIRCSLDAAVDEMALALVRTARSINLKSSMDVSCALCDIRGRVLAQGETLPLILGAVPVAIKAVLEKFGNEVEEGDVFLLNDPFHGGSHLPDLYLFKPIFIGESHVAWSISEAHHLDIGGMTAGGNGTDATEIYQEGLRIPPVKLIKAGVPNEAVFDILKTNVRVPDYVMGDLQAQIAACNTGERSFVSLVSRYQLETLMTAAEALLDQAEYYTRSAISQMPDGIYNFTDYLDNDGLVETPIEISVTITVTGDQLTADFTGSSPRTRGALNCTMSMTMSAVYAAVRYLIPGSVPNNEGLFRPIRITAPEGCVVNAVHPASVAARGLTGFRIGNAVFGALAKIVPDKVFACEVGGDCGVSFSSIDEKGRPIVFLEFLCGSWGARPFADGIDGCSSAFVNFANNSIELVELEYPILFERYGYVPDTGGAGKYRGGLAIERHYRFLMEEGHLQMRTDRTHYQPYGLKGGEAGTHSRTVLVRGDKTIELPGKCKIQVQKGDVLRHQLAGAGGWGNPLDRDPDLVNRDLLEGKISIEFANVHHPQVSRIAAAE